MLHEETDSGMPRVPIRAVQSRSNLSGMYHRNKSMGSKKEKGRAMRKGEKEGGRKKKQRGKKEEKM